MTRKLFWAGVILAILVLALYGAIARLAPDRQFLEKEVH